MMVMIIIIVVVIIMAIKISSWILCSVYLKDANSRIKIMVSKNLKIGKHTENTSSEQLAVQP